MHVSHPDPRLCPWFWQPKHVKFTWSHHARRFLIGVDILVRSTLVLVGVPQGATQNTLVATYGDLANVEELIKGDDVAAVILEPVVGNSGYIKPTKVIYCSIFIQQRRVPSRMKIFARQRNLVLSRHVIPRRTFVSNFRV